MESRLTKAIAVVGLLASALAMAVVVGVDQTLRVVSYTRTESGGVKYSGVFTAWIEPPYRVPIAVISVVVIASAAVLLLGRLPRHRRVIVGLTAVGDVLLVLWLGVLSIAYLELWGIQTGIPGFR